MAKDSIYITGWEYNRLLAHDPTEPMRSSLPLAAFYQGGFQFWLFKNIYCTEESFTTEVLGTEAVGWVQGKILTDLRTDGLLHPYSWTDFKASKSPAYEQFVDTSKALKSTYSREAIIQLLKEYDASQLESIKIKFLQPLFNHLNCVADVTPNAISHWKSKPAPTLGREHPPDILLQIAEPIMNKRSEFSLGLTICRRPGADATMHELKAQKAVQDEVERPMIPSLLACELKFDDYIATLAPHRSAYEPINQQLLKDWRKSREKILRLRELAAKHIWPDLHGEWLPRLEEEKDFAGKFKTLLGDAILRAKMGSYFDRPIQLAIQAVSIGAGFAVGSAANSIPVGAFVAAGTKTLLEEPLKRRQDETRNLTLFYQAAKRLK